MVQSTTGIKESIIELILAFYSASSFFGVAEKNKGDKNKCGCASNTKLLHVHRLSRRYFLLPDISNSLFLSLCLYTLHSAPENNEKNVCFYVWVIDAPSSLRNSSAQTHMITSKDAFPRIVATKDPTQIPPQITLDRKMTWLEQWASKFCHIFY
jgi:hypothetical protein